MPVAEGARCTGDQGRWLSSIANTIMTAVSLCELGHARYQLTSIGADTVGEVAKSRFWVTMLSYAALWLVAWVPMGPWNPNADPHVCAGRLASLWMRRYQDLSMVALLAIITHACGDIVLVNCHFELRLDADRVLQGLPSVFGAPNARRQYITTRSRAVAGAAVLAKLPFRPLFPGLLLSRAYLLYHYVSPYWGRQVDIIMSSLLAIMYTCVVVLVDLADVTGVRLR